MKAPLAAMAALAGGLLFLPAVQGPASATSVPINLKNVLGSTAAHQAPLSSSAMAAAVGAAVAVEVAAPAAAVAVAAPVVEVAAVRLLWRRWRWRSRPLRRRRWPQLHERRRRSEPRRRRAARALSPTTVLATSTVVPGLTPAAISIARDRGAMSVVAMPKPSIATATMTTATVTSHESRRFAERDHDRDHDFDHHGRHRVFRNGVWIWVYGPDYYSYNDCWWLRRQALATGSPYWWSRYNACVSSY